MRKDYRKMERNLEILKIEINKTNALHSKDYRFIDAHLHILYSNTTLLYNYINNHLDKEINRNIMDIINIKESLIDLWHQLNDLNEK